MPPQLWVPAGQLPLQALALGMHAPRHSFIPPGHAGTHAIPSQLTVPSVGAAQAWQDVVPQLAISVLLTQRLPHRCVPVLHTSPQAPPAQFAVPFGSVAHGVHATPQVCDSSLGTQPAGHMCFPGGQTGTTGASVSGACSTGPLSTGLSAPASPGLSNSAPSGAAPSGAPPSAVPPAPPSPP